MVAGNLWGLHEDGGRGEAFAVFFQHVSSLPAAQGDLHLLSEQAGGQGVEYGVQGTVDGKDEDDYPAGDGVYRRRVVLFYSSSSIN